MAISRDTYLRLLAAVAAATTAVAVATRRSGRASALAGAFVFDSNNAKLCIWTGTAWKTSAAFT